MPKKNNPKKEEDARILLKEGRSIRNIREILTKKYGSALSPNLLCDIKNEIFLVNYKKIFETVEPVNEKIWPNLLNPSEKINYLNDPILIEILDVVRENSRVLRNFIQKVNEFMDKEVKSEEDIIENSKNSELFMEDINYEDEFELSHRNLVSDVEKIKKEEFEKSINSLKLVVSEILMDNLPKTIDQIAGMTGISFIETSIIIDELKKAKSVKEIKKGIFINNKI